jgi:hypothetical protein
MSASAEIDAYIAGIEDWRGPLIAELRQLVLSLDPEIEEAVKWGVPLFSYKGLLCSAAAFKEHVGMNFFQGAVVPDPDSLFNSGLDAKKTRMIKFFEDSKLDKKALKALLMSAMAQNRG